MKTTSILLSLGAALGAFCPVTPSAFAQGTAFTYQGRLNNNGAPANGSYDLSFALFDAASAGLQPGNPLTNSPTLVSNGLFTVTLDFGNQFPGADRWLEIAVRTNGGGAFAALSPRQPLTPTPYAMFAANANTLNAASNQPVNLSVNGTKVLRISLVNSFFGITANSVGGSPANVISNGFVGGFIGGGGASPSYPNRVGADYASVLGGFNNTASGYGSTAMGESTVASGSVSTAMGESTVASGAVSTAMGNRAKANHQGTFAWADSQNADLTSTANNQFLIRAAGGVGINTNNPAGAALAVVGGIRAGVNGTIQSRVQFGTATVGTGTNGVNTFTITFPTAFSSPPKVFVMTKGNDNPDTFGISTRAVSTLGFKVNILRLDTAAGWGQALQVDWYAVE